MFPPSNSSHAPPLVHAKIYDFSLLNYCVVSQILNLFILFPTLFLHDAPPSIIVINV